MTIKIGSSLVSKMYIGATPINAIYLGSTNIYSSTPNIIISSDQINLNLHSYALANGWDGNSALVITVNSGVYISGNTPGINGFALVVDGTYPNGVTLINNGNIVGMGGHGGVNDSTGTAVPSGQLDGGTALKATSAITIDNTNGLIAGGGGGGGAGEASYSDGKQPYYDPSGGGGGGRSGRVNSKEGYGYARNYNDSSIPYVVGGSPGTVNGPGAGGAPYHSSNLTDVGGYGGNGGDYGSPGQTGLQGSRSGGPGAPTQGGAGGRSVDGNTNITWINTGVRLGAIV